MTCHEASVAKQVSCTPTVYHAAPEMAFSFADMGLCRQVSFLSGMMQSVSGFTDLRTAVSSTRYSDHG
jgi:hypothetical protein